MVRDLIKNNPDLDDKEVTDLFNQTGNPTLAPRVVKAMRAALTEGEIE